MRSCTAILFLVLAVGGSGQNPPPQAPFQPTTRQCTATGDLDIREIKSAVFKNTRKLRILLPHGYRNPEHADTKYPVLYLNDGQNLFDVCTSIFNPMEWQVDESADRLIAEGKVEPLIIVGIDNAGKRDRPREYLPLPDDTLRPYIAEVHGDRYPEFLTSEVMPFIQKNYRAKRGAENTGLGGSSYGGLIAFYTALHTSNTLGRLLLESPSIYVQDYAVLKQAAKHSNWPARIYLGFGTAEPVAEDMARLQKTLHDDGIGAERLFVNITSDKHNEDAWAKRFPAALEFLFPRK